MVLAGALALTACTDDGGGSAAELCAAIGDGQALSRVFEAFDPTDTDRALDQLRTARVRLGELHDLAPSEVQGALTTEIQYVQALIDGLEAAPADDPAAAVAAVNGLDEQRAAVEQANAELEAFEERECAPAPSP